VVVSVPLFFLVSDCLIGIDKFVCPVPLARVLIMSSYYAAQALLALSAVNKDNLMFKIKMSERKVVSSDTGKHVE